MAKKGKKKSEESTKPKPEIIGKGIGKKTGKGKELEAVAKGVETLSSTASGSHALNTNASGSNDEYAGYIFLCNGRTKPECFSYRVFGLPSPRIDVVEKIKPNAKLFLFDFDVKLLYGVYTATSTGIMNLEPHAFGGRFPAQIKFEIFKECMPIPESNFRHVIKDNYQGRSKFRQDLSAEQVYNLISLFRPLSPSSAAPRTSLLSNELQSRNILHQEIEKQNRTPSISTPASQQNIGSRFGHSSYQAPLSLSPYDRPSVLFQHLPSSRLLPHYNSVLLEHSPQSYYPECLATTPQLQGLTSRYANERLLSGIEINPHTRLPNDYYLYKSQDIGQSHVPAQIPQQISAPPQESDRAPSSVLAAAYWVAVGNEIPQSGVHQTSDSAHNVTGQNNTSLRYKPPNLNPASILDAYWEAKALEDSRQQHPGPSHFAESAQWPSQSLAAPYGAAVESGDQNHLLHSNQQPILSNQPSAFPNSHNATEVGNQVPAYGPGPQQQVFYDPTKPQMQHGLSQYQSTYNL
ncbi:hypothetical protein QQ045_023362 [Rhodiola kirilowii]